MTDRAGHRAQLEAMQEARTRTSPRQELHEKAVAKYLRMQDQERRKSEEASARASGNGRQWHERLNVEGRDVDVTEDAFGIVELREK